MRLPAIYLLSLAIISTNICGCATTSNEQENLNAVLWLQTSSEFSAASIGTYAGASTALRKIVADGPTDIDRMVVVLDVDETVLTHINYQAQSVLDNVAYQHESFDRWAALREVPAVPGALEFIKASQDLGVGIMFITNRQCRERDDSSDDCPNKEDTLVNLRQLGITVDSDRLYFLGDRRADRCLNLPPESDREKGRWISSDKTYRRQCVELDHEIVMLIGDQLGDFIGGLEETTPESRKALLGQYKEKWGNTWFMIPNPTYGSWLNLLAPDKRSHLRGW